MAAYKIYEDYIDMVKSFGIDENWLDVTESIKLFGSGTDIISHTVSLYFISSF